LPTSAKPANIQYTDQGRSSSNTLGGVIVRNVRF
jgi:hypothetical protein